MGMGMATSYKLSNANTERSIQTQGLPMVLLVIYGGDFMLCYHAKW